MLLVTKTEFLDTRTDTPTAVKMIADAGFDAYDLSMFDTNLPLYKEGYHEYLKKIKETADKCGIRCTQSHAPFPSAISGNDEFNKKRFDEIVRAFECAAYLGAEIIVVHPIQHFKDGDDPHQMNVEFYKKLLPYAKKFGIKIATENMWGYDEKRACCIKNVCSDAEMFNKMIDDINDEYLVGCLDLGHCGLVGEEAQDMLRQMGSKRIKALHIHDNDYRNDSHTIPYMGKMNWEEIMKAIAEIGYEGNFTYEACSFFQGLPTDCVDIALEMMSKLGRRMIKKIEDYK